MRLESEDQLLDIKTRKAIIDEIKSDGNMSRKRKAYKRYECYKDEVSKYVQEQILKQFDPVTVQEMHWSISNINVTRKVTDKLSRVYSNGVVRTVGEEKQANEDIDNIGKALAVDTKMKQLNRFLKLQKNLTMFVKPYKCKELGAEKWSIRLEPLNPYLYDLLEDANDRESPIGYVLSDYITSGTAYVSGTEASTVAQAGRNSNVPVRYTGDSQAAAKDDDSEDKSEYVFWTDKYHFTCNCKGDLINDQSQQNLNPIGQKPFVNFAIDQDGCLWAKGGDDLVDGSILINSMITFTNHIGVTQGYGQFWAKGANLPQTIKTGPNKAILLKTESKDDPEPAIGFANANPQLAELRNLIEMYVALLLTTNNLTTKGVSLKLEGGQSPASGVALILDKAESLEDVQDQQQIFHDKEPEMWDIIIKWLNLYGSKKLLTKDLQDLTIPKTIEGLRLKFNEATPIMSESEKLANLKLRKDLGINTMIELIMKDDPALTEKDAEQKLLKLVEEDLKLRALGLANYPELDPANQNNQNSQGGMNGDQGNGADSNGRQDGLQDKPGAGGLAKADPKGN